MAIFSYVLVNCDTSHEDYISSTLKSMTDVRNVHGAFGSYDLIAQIEKSDRDEIINIANRIRDISHVRTTLTLFANEQVDYFKPIIPSVYETIKRHMAEAYVLINSRKSAELVILEKLSKVPEIIEGNSVIGPYDIIVHVVAPTYNEISEIVSKVIRKIEDIKSTYTINLIP